MYKTECEQCGKTVNEDSFFFSFHIAKDVICMLLLIAKMFTWMLYKSFTLTESLRNFPCTCGHKAFWHMPIFKVAPLSMNERDWFYLLINYKFERDETQPLADCLKCAFKLNNSYYKRCYEFVPLNNLTYLENLYKKK